MSFEDVHFESLTVGRIVHYRGAGRGECLAALVVERGPVRVRARVFVGGGSGYDIGGPGGDLEVTLGRDNADRWHDPRNCPEAG